MEGSSLVSWVAIVRLNEIVTEFQNHACYAIIIELNLVDIPTYLGSTWK